MSDQAAQTMPERPEFSVDEALRIADQNADAYDKVASVSRTLAAEVRRLTALSQPAGMAEPLPMDTAPRDGTMVRLLVNFTDHATEDTAGPAWTIGAYPSDDESGGWQFAGWCWTHDHFTEGEGTPIGWLPMLAAAPAASGGEDDMCPNCVTPWKCNGPHALPPSAPHPDALPDGTLSKSTAKRVTALAAASVSERARDDLHVAICQAVALMNMEPMTTTGLLQAHDILRKAIS